MKYEKIRAESAAECMMKVRGKYGSSAIILQTREVKEGGILGIMAKTLYEVYFMVEESPHSKKMARRSEMTSEKILTGEKKSSSDQALQKDSREEITETFDRLQKKKDRLSALIAEKSIISEQESPSGSYQKKSALETVRPVPGESKKRIPEVNALPLQNGYHEEPVSISDEEMLALMKWKGEDDKLEMENDSRNSSGAVMRSEVLPGSDADIFFSADRSERNVFKIRKMLLGSQLSAEFTEAFMKSLDHDLSRKEKCEYRLIEKKAIARLSEIIHTVPDIAPPRGECRAVMLIGPTGSGKTTSIAKLAAKYHLMEKREVSLYSLDHYRLAATEQLKIYADVMSVPFFAPVSPEEFSEYLKRDGAEIMLIDTSGIGVSDKNRLLELKKFVNACTVRLEKHLVLAANTNTSSLEKIIEAYDESIGFDKILLTKVDETDFFGSFIEFADKFNRPFSFLTNGQEVPGDLIAPLPEELARMVLGEALHAG